MATRGAGSVPTSKSPRAGGDKRSQNPQRPVGGTSNSMGRLARHPSQAGGHGGNATRREQSPRKR